MGDPTAQYSSLSALGRQALRELVGESLRTNGLGRGMPEDQRISAAIELIEHGFARLEHDPANGSYRLVPTVRGDSA